MTRHIVSACGAIALASIVASAQTPPPTQRTQQAGGQNTVTITGCLKVWDETLGMARSDVASPRAETPGPRQFIVAGARDGGMSRTYVLDTSSAGVNLRPHVNHTVEVTGIPRGTTDGNTPAPGSSDAAALSMLTVTSVRMISSDCR